MACILQNRFHITMFNPCLTGKSGRLSKGMKSNLEKMPIIANEVPGHFCIMIKSVLYLKMDAGKSVAWLTERLLL